MCYVWLMNHEPQERSTANTTETTNL